MFDRHEDENGGARTRDATNWVLMLYKATHTHTYGVCACQKRVNQRGMYQKRLCRKKVCQPEVGMANLGVSAAHDLVDGIRAVITRILRKRLVFDFR